MFNPMHSGSVNALVVEHRYAWGLAGMKDEGLLLA